MEVQTLYDSTDEHFTRYSTCMRFQKIQRIKQICRFRGTSKN